MGLARSVEVVLVGEGFSIDASRDGILIEDDVVGETGVISPGNGVTLGDGNSGGVEDQGTCRNKDIK